MAMQLLTLENINGNAINNVEVLMLVELSASLELSMLVELLTRVELSMWIEFLMSLGTFASLKLLV